jgi:hypothetical protein
MGLDDLARITTEALGEMPEKLKVASDGFKNLVDGFHDLVRNT